MVLHEGKVAEMATGEGKTLAALLPALSGRGVHIITVNVYLAARDREWCRPGHRNPPSALSLFTPAARASGRSTFAGHREDARRILGAACASGARFERRPCGAPACASLQRA